MSKKYDPNFRYQLFEAGFSGCQHSCGELSGMRGVFAFYENRSDARLLRLTVKDTLRNKEYTAEEAYNILYPPIVGN